MSSKIMLSESERSELTWSKAQRSTHNGQCVEIASAAGRDARTCNCRAVETLGHSASGVTSAWMPIIIHRRLEQNPIILARNQLL